MAGIKLPDVEQASGDQMLRAAEATLEKIAEIASEDLATVASYFMGTTHLFSRTTVKLAWYTGGLFWELKDRMEHGEWMPFLEEHDLPHTTVSQYMRLYDNLTEEQIEEFGTTRDALKAIRRAKQEADDSSEEAVPVETKPERLSKEDQLRQQIQTLETGVKVEREAREEVEEKLKEVEEQNKHLLTGERVKEGYQAGLSVLEERQNEIRQQKVTIKDLREKLNESRKDLTSYRKWATNELKKKDKRIHDLEVIQEQLEEKLAKIEAEGG